MKVELTEKIGAGAFAEVWKGKDELNRTVAVKIIRASVACISNALDHARALARAEHPNVVRVYSTETVVDPDTGQEAQAVLMEFLEGELLLDTFKHLQFQRHEALSLCNAIVAGLRHIHVRGLAHGDLHASNVILTIRGPKIIDILYQDSLALLSTMSRQDRTRRDVAQLASLLYDILWHSDVEPDTVQEFQRRARDCKDVDEIASILASTVIAQGQERLEQVVTYAVGRLVDDGFVDSEVYAQALAEDIPLDATSAVLNEIVEKGLARHQHRHLLGKLWARLSPQGRKDLMVKLGNRLDKEIPGRRWTPWMQMLAAAGVEGWRLLPTTSRLRLEYLITKGHSRRALRCT